MFKNAKFLGLSPSLSEGSGAEGTGRLMFELKIKNRIKDKQLQDMNNTNIRKRHESPYLCHGIDLAILITARMQTIGEDCQDVTIVSVGWALKGTETQRRKKKNTNADKARTRGGRMCVWRVG